MDKPTVKQGLVERLRTHFDDCPPRHSETSSTRPLLVEAAAEVERLREALQDAIGQLHWINAQAENAMATSAGAATSNGDQDGALQMLNSIASDIGVNAMMLSDKLTAALGEP